MKLRSLWKTMKIFSKAAEFYKCFSFSDHLGSSFPSSSNVKYKTSLFHCESGEYLSWLSVCNGLPECDDMSDELNCNYGNNKI